MTHWVKFHDAAGRVKWIWSGAIVAVSSAKGSGYPDGKWSDLTLSGVKRPVTVRSSIVEVLAAVGARGSALDQEGEP